MFKTFTAQLEDFVDKTADTLEAVAKQSIQDVFEGAQTPVAQGGRMPVYTGCLRNSLQARLNGTTSLTGPDAYVLAVAGMELAGVMFGGWTATYAAHMEFGAQGRPARAFMRSAAQQWQGIVNRNAKACVDAPCLASRIFDLSAGSSIGRVSGL